MRNRRTAFVICFLTLLSFFAFPACGGNSDTVGQAFVFTGQWESSELTLTSGRCDGLLVTTPEVLPGISYSVEQVGENITLTDSSGTLTGAAEARSFRVFDESGGPGATIDPSNIVEELAGPNTVCTVKTTISYGADSETTGEIFFILDFSCVDSTTGFPVNSCTLRYRGTTQRLSDTL